jgi:hypothetical protein
MGAVLTSVSSLILSSGMALSPVLLPAVPAASLRPRVRLLTLVLMDTRVLDVIPRLLLVEHFPTVVVLTRLLLRNVFRHAVTMILSTLEWNMEERYVPKSFLG